MRIILGRPLTGDAAVLVGERVGRKARVMGVAIRGVPNDYLFGRGPFQLGAGDGRRRSWVEMAEVSGLREPRTDPDLLCGPRDMARDARPMITGSSCPSCHYTFRM